MVDGRESSRRSKFDWASLEFHCALVSLVSFVISGRSLTYVGRYFISAIEAWSPAEYRTFAIIGDSITDGRGSDTNKNNR